MPSDLSSYLATHYLTADPKPSKKRKRKHDKSSGRGLLIQDDDDWGSGGGGSSSSRKSKSRTGLGGGEDGEDDDVPVTVGKVRDFRKTTKANWKTVGGAAADDESAAADAILASAAAENEAARRAEDEDPTVVAEEQRPAAAAAAVATMADGSHAGLQSAAAVTAQLERRQREEREQFEAERRAGLVRHGEEETFYRDATGRRVDVSMRRAEARRAALEAEEKERAREEMLKGEVQLEEARRRKEVLEEARGLAVARTADDAEMNRELKEQRRWNDPMARFLDAEEERSGAKAAADGGAGAKAGKKTSRRPVYKGPAPPNRYGIRPGYRWDGVDRSNGFEAERFKAINRRERNKGLDYAWQMDE